MGGFYGLKAAAAGWLTAVVLVCPASEDAMLDGLEETEARNEDSEATPGRSAAPGDVVGGAAQPAAPTRWDVPRMQAYFQRQRSPEIAKRVRCPTMLVHARGDDVVPLRHSLALTAHLGGDVTLLILEGGTHTSAQHDPALHAYTARWLLERVRNACTART
jgi:pimeloyl-ACP methyl ester carboxylesterase